MKVREVDCMACVANLRGIEHQGTHTDRAGITHATTAHPSYGAYQAILCSAREDGRLRLVPR